MVGVTTFCGVLTLQVGVTVLAAVFLTLGAVILVANALEVYDDGGGDEGDKGGKDEGGGGGHDQKKGDDKKDDEGSTNWFYYFIVAFAIMLIIIGLLAFFSAYKESRGLAFCALLLLILSTALWIVMCFLSVLGSTKTRGSVCYDRRCPESLWLANFNYRTDDKNRTKREITNYEGFQSMPLETLNSREVQLTELNSVLQSGCKECSNTKKANKSSPCSSCTFLNMSVDSAKSVISNAVANKIIKLGINESDQMKNPFLQNKSADWPLGFGMRHLVETLITNHENKNTTEVEHRDESHSQNKDKGKKGKNKVEKEGTLAMKIIKRGINESDNTEKPLLLDQSADWPSGFGMRYLANDKADKPSKYNFGFHFITALIIFFANLIFFIFSMLIFWSWAQELGDECDFDEIYYIYE